MQLDHEHEYEAHTPAPRYLAVFERAYVEAIHEGLSVRRAEQIAADAAGSEHLNRRGNPAKDF